MELARLLRERMFNLLREIVFEQEWYPRTGELTGRANFMLMLAMHFVDRDPDPEKGETVESLLVDYALSKMYNHEWAGVQHDPLLAALLLQRSIVVVRPNIYGDVFERYRPQWNSTDFEQALEIFMPDGTTLVIFYSFCILFNFILFRMLILF